MKKQVRRNIQIAPLLLTTLLALGGCSDKSSSPNAPAAASEKQNDGQVTFGLELGSLEATRTELKEMGIEVSSTENKVLVDPKRGQPDSLETLVALKRYQNSLEHMAAHYSAVRPDEAAAWKRDAAIIGNHIETSMKDNGVMQETLDQAVMSEAARRMHRALDSFKLPEAAQPDTAPRAAEGTDLPSSVADLLGESAEPKLGPEPTVPYVDLSPTVESASQTGIDLEVLDAEKFNRLVAGGGSVKAGFTPPTAVIRAGQIISPSEVEEGQSFCFILQNGPYSVSEGQKIGFEKLEVLNFVIMAFDLDSEIALSCGINSGDAVPSLSDFAKEFEGVAYVWPRK